jgi:LemA protein
VQPEERIRRMEEEGTITPSQAAMLRDSLGPAGGAGEDPAGSRTWAKWAPTALGVLAAAIAIVWVALPGADPGVVQDVAESLNQPGGHGEMNKSLSALLAVALLLVVPLMIGTWMHNQVVGQEEKVFEAWAQTESTFQRRADLIPALVETVSRYLKHESETLTAVTEARAGALADAVDGLIKAQKASTEVLGEKGREIIEDETVLRRLHEAEAGVGRGMTGLFVAVEAYPELHSSDQFLELQAQLEGTENRINVARMRFNQAVGVYNGTIRKLPWSLIATLGGFQRKAYFRSDEEARDAPELGFN